MSGNDELKRCSCCKEYKHRAIFFSKDASRKDGYSIYCKPCGAAKKGIKNYGKYKRAAALREEGKKRCSRCEVLKDSGEYYKDNSRAGGYRHRCKECERENRSGKKYKEKQREYSRKSHWKNKKRRNKYSRGYNQKKKNKDRRNKLTRKRYYSDPAFRLGAIVKSRVYKSLKNWEGYKNDKYFSALGYTPEDLVKHIESQWKEEWNWDNYGEVWVIDHIYPHSKLPYDSLEHPNYKKAWALSNLRPLCIKENLRKSDKILVE